MMYGISSGETSEYETPLRPARATRPVSKNIFIPQVLGKFLQKYTLHRNWGKLENIQVLTHIAKLV